MEYPNVLNEPVCFALASYACTLDPQKSVFWVPVVPLA